MVSNTLYRGIVEVAKAVTVAQGLKMHTSGEENIPTTGGAVLAINHTGYMDFVLGGFLPRERGRLVRYLAKSGIFQQPAVGWLMRMMGHIPVDRIDGKASFNAAVEAARAGEIVGIFPEGTISRSFEIKNMRTGAVRIAQEAGVPIIPTVLFGSQRLWTKNGRRHLGRSHIPIYISALEPLMPGPDAQEETEKLRERMRSGLQDQWRAYQRDYGEFPQGEFWVPARFGGGAPSPEDTQVEDSAIENERYRIRRLTEDLTGLNARIKEVSRNMAGGVYEAYDTAVDKAKGAIARAHASVTESAQQSARDTQGLVEWVKSSIDELSVEGSSGVKEGAERISAAVDQLKNNAQTLYTQLAADSAEAYDGSRLEEALTRLAAQSRQILDRLPHRVRQRFVGLPEAVVCDLDGTLVADDGTVARRDVEALRECMELGTRVIVTSEYGPDEWHRTVAEMGLDTQPVGVCYGGTMVVAGGDAAVGAVKALSEQQVEAVAGGVDKLGEQVELSWRTAAGGTDKIAAVVHVPGRTAREVAGRLQELVGEQARVTWSSPTRVQVTAPGVDKGSAVAEVLERLGIAADKVVAFGRAPSDIPVLQLVGYSVAVANADSAVLRASGATTAGSNESGVGQFMEAVLRAVTEGQNQR